jgi:hypothetical protein
MVSADTSVSQPTLIGVGLALGAGAAVAVGDAEADGVPLADPLADGVAVGTHPLSRASASTPSVTVASRRTVPGMRPL